MVLIPLAFQWARVYHFFDAWLSSYLFGTFLGILSLRGTVVDAMIGYTIMWVITTLPLAPFLFCVRIWGHHIEVCQVEEEEGCNYLLDILGHTGYGDLVDMLYMTYPSPWYLCPILVLQWLCQMGTLLCIYVLHKQKVTAMLVKMAKDEIQDVTGGMEESSSSDDAVSPQMMASFLNTPLSATSLSFAGTPLGSAPHTPSMAILATSASNPALQHCVSIPPERILDMTRRLGGGMVTDTEYMHTHCVLRLVPRHPVRDLTAILTQLRNGFCLSSSDNKYIKAGSGWAERVGVCVDVGFIPKSQPKESTTTSSTPNTPNSTSSPPSPSSADSADSANALYTECVPWVRNGLLACLMHVVAESDALSTDVSVSSAEDVIRIREEALEQARSEATLLEQSSACSTPESLSAAVSAAVDTALSHDVPTLMKQVQTPQYKAGLVFRTVLKQACLLFPAQNGNERTVGVEIDFR
ncbi:hypothetical protein KIPB_009047 [Kipferlia bialata]|uniref:Uncharacterized protein n=1 Tax=Kipferlia bialata TaxID=797122 RepID=A0A9K3D124_9EUKA|nr:hypothetical protein KIPB_009047 [Kipferlia bialata]|eukprot:g9047.t1